MCAVYFCVALCKLYFYCNLAYKYIASAHLVYVFCAYIWLSIYIYYVVEMFIMISIFFLKFCAVRATQSILLICLLCVTIVYVSFSFFVMRWVTFEPFCLVFLIILLCTWHYVRSYSANAILFLLFLHCLFF